MSDQENRRIFGEWASPFNHGHNYLLEVTVGGSIDPQTGMIVNIKTIDRVVREQIVREFDGKSINDEIDYFRSHSSTTENIALYITRKLSAKGVMPASTVLEHVRLYEKEDLFVDITLQEQPVTAGQGVQVMTFTRSYEFAAAHRLHVPTLSEAQNIELFGKCNSPAGHGHNYILEVSVEGTPDPETGMMVDLGKLDQVVEELVVDRYDHQHLNVDVPEFQDRTPTSEVIAAEIFDRLKDRLPAKLAKIRLYETARNVFEVTA